MKVLFVLTLLVAIAFAWDDLETGNGICSICSQVSKKQECCSGNLQCVYEDKQNSCTQTDPVRSDGTMAVRVFAEELYNRGDNDFCSVCCGKDKETTLCCSGSTSCRCTKSLAPSCINE